MAWDFALSMDIAALPSPSVLPVRLEFGGTTNWIVAIHFEPISRVAPKVIAVPTRTLRTMNHFRLLRIAVTRQKSMYSFSLRPGLPHSLTLGQSLRQK